MSCLKLYLLGPPRAERTDGPCTFDRRKAMALLAYLAVTGQPHRRGHGSVPENRACRL